MTDSVWVVIPAFNESAVIATTLADLKAHAFGNVVVVDDCSSDDTNAIAGRAGAHVVRHPVNLGQGAAIRTGIDYALSQGAAFIVTFDADGQHRPEDAAAMIEALRHGEYDVALSSRFRGGAIGMPGLKRAVLKAAVWFTRVTTGLDVTDTHNGLRVFTRSATARIEIRQNRMAHASEILSEIAHHKLRWVELPGTIRYTAYSIGKGQRLSGAVEILKDLLVRGLKS